MGVQEEQLPEGLPTRQAMLEFMAGLLVVAALAALEFLATLVGTARHMVLAALALQFLM